MVKVNMTGKEINYGMEKEVFFGRTFGFGIK